MHRFRASLLACLAAASLWLLGCGGSVVDGLGPSGDGGPPTDGQVGPDSIGMPTDSSPPPIDSPIIIGEGGACLVNLEPCISSSQCCSGYCDANSHQCNSLGPPPPCTPDGYSCQNGAQCCGGSCFNGYCGGSTYDTGACYPDGYGCYSAAECCSGLCGGGVCGGVIYDSGSCQYPGSYCGGGSYCCYGPCVNGYCQYPDASTCQPDGNYCQNYSDCCSGVCGNGICGGVIYDSGPVCNPDGYGCQSYTQCCSGVCSFGVCGNGYVDAGPPPPMCYPPVGNVCNYCLASACCSQLGACENDYVCTQDLNCFNGCYTQGSGNAAACSQKCLQAYPSPLAQNLMSCATNCQPSCN